jgi:hypothetical protein
MSPVRRLVPALALLALALGCRATPFGTIQREDARAHLDQAEADVAAGAFARALERLAAVHDVRNLDPDLRAREQALVDAAARGRFGELEGADADELEELFESELPERVRARAGILAAERLLAAERRISAFRLVKKVDLALPGHAERVLAGDVLARAGLSLVRDRRRYNLLFHYRPRGVQALEYLVLNYPLDAHCPEAYFELSRVYEERGELDQAVERTEDLLLYHPESAYAAAASARLPYLRLLRLKRDDYDRGELLRAEAELEAWLAHHPGHELESWARELLRESERRLVLNDLSLARYYAKLRAPAGVRLHAERARGLALEAGFAAEAAAAEAVLTRLAPTQAVGAAASAPAGPASDQP